MPTVTTAQSSYLETVSLGEAKTHLRIHSQEFDREVESAIAAAVDWCECYTGRTLRTAVEQVTAFDCWFSVGGSSPIQPVLDVVSVEYYDVDNVLQTLDASNYRLISTDGLAARVEIESGATLPNLSVRSDAVRITYTTGYATIEDVPPRAKQAIKMMLSVYWGDLSPREVEVWERQASKALDSLDWGAYR